MKKSLLLAAAAIAAVSASAEVFTYDFYSTPAFCAGLMDENSDVYQGGGNFEFIDKYGMALPNDAGVQLINTPEGGSKGLIMTGLGISLYDGKLYKLTENLQNVPESFDPASVEMMPAECLDHPFLSWGEKGVTRTLLMTGWGSLDAYEDKNYNGATPSDWVATKNGFAFNRTGTQNMVSRNDTYIQFPAVTGNVTIELWVGTASDKSNKEQPIKVLVTPVVNGVADTENAIAVEKAYGTFPEKRMVKLAPITYDATGKNVAFQIGANGAVLHLYHVVITGDKPTTTGIEDIIVNEADENAPVYNVLGQQVDASYKGIVIKNGKKYIQK